MFLQKYCHCLITNQGTSHKETGLPCQDYGRHRTLKTKDGKKEYRIVVVCDGLGSVPKADVASKLACDETVEFFRSFIKDEYGFEKINISLESIAADLIRSIRKRMAREAQEKNFPVEHLDTTLNFLVIDISQKKAIVGRLGDGAVIIVKQSGTEVMTTGKTSLSTASILSKYAERELEIRMIDMNDCNILGFILTTDGLEGEIYWKNSSIPKQNAAKYFNSVLNEEQKKNMRNNIGHLQRNEYFEDDICLFILSRATNYINLPPDPTWKCGKCGTNNDVFAGYCSQCGKDFHMFYEGKTIQEHGGRVAYFKMLNEKDRASHIKK